MTYGNNPLTLKDISLSVKSGEKIAILGESGCGKSTLAKLFLRFYDPEEGTLQLNGRNLKDMSLREIRQKVAYVSQDTFLFSDTIRNNLLLGANEVTEEEIQAVCDACCLSEFLSTLPQGLDTTLDENGGNLSGGQRQWIAIARALLQKPELLILDEATSNLDTVTEEMIKETIERYTRGIACIIIAHRLSTVEMCDRSYVIKVPERQCH